MLRRGVMGCVVSEPLRAGRKMSFLEDPRHPLWVRLEALVLLCPPLPQWTGASLFFAEVSVSQIVRSRSPEVPESARRTFVLDKDIVPTQPQTSAGRAPNRAGIPAVSAFPEMAVGPARTSSFFRDLLGFHAGCGLHTPAPIASGGSDVAGWASHPPESALSRRTPGAVIRPRASGLASSLAMRVRPASGEQSNPPRRS